MLTPAWFTRVTPGECGATPFTDATMIEPAGDVVKGLIESIMGVREIPFGMKTSSPSGVPMGR